MFNENTVLEEEEFAKQSITPTEVQNTEAL